MFFDNIDEFEDVDNVLVIFFIGLTGGITPIGLRPSAIRFAQRSSSFLSFKLNCDESFDSVINFSFIFCCFVDSNVSFSSYLIIIKFKINRAIN